MFTRLLREPPFRLLAKAAARYCPTSLATKVNWEAAERPHYALGILFATQEAQRLGIPSICAIEFGVARGKGLLVMERHAALAQNNTRIQIHVFGFDLGRGLPASSDFRDHPDRWKAGDFPMDGRLQEKLRPDTQLILGDVSATVPEFVKRQSAPVGFVAFDLDFYSSTRAAMQLFTLPGHKMLPHTPVYFDDISEAFNHSFAGELLAIDEFNRESECVKFDRWRGAKSLTSFPESPWLDSMYVAHDLTAAPTTRTEALLL